MKITEVVEALKEALKVISKQAAIDRKFFGPVYHGTSDENRSAIAQQGFKVYGTDDIDRRNGFAGIFNTNYPGIPPIHLLGYGVYFTTVKAVARQYNQNSMRGIVEYYIDAPRMESIGFQSTNTIWKWWVQNGYDFDPKIAALKDKPENRYAGNRLVVDEQVRATRNMTITLSSKFDAVHLRKSSFRRGVDDEQIVVFDPARIYQVDAKLAGGWDIGAVVTHNQNIHYSPAFMQQYGVLAEKQPDGWTWLTRPPHQEPGQRIVLMKIPPSGMKGTIVGKSEAPRAYTAGAINPRLLNQASYWISVKWTRGGIQRNYIEGELDPVRPVQEHAH
jgi:hypothetical protein